MISPHHGNFAPFVLFCIFPLTLYLLSTRKPEPAIAFLAFFCTLWAPVGVYFKLPSFPALQKDNFPYLAMMIGLLIFKPKIVFKAKPGRGPEFLMFVSLFASLATWKTNTDVLSYGSWITTVLPALTFIDGMAMGLDQIVRVGLPFFIGRAVFNKSEHLDVLMKAMVVAGLVYTIPILIELRMSPRAHYWIYGYDASPNFLQALRWGGYRPMGCMPHGLALSMLLFQMCCSATAMTLAKMKIVNFAKSKTVAIYLLVILVACKSSGAITYAIVSIPMLLKTKLTTQMRVATVLAALALGYPVIKGAGYIPDEGIVDFIESIAPERALSIKFRFENEEMLQEKNTERPWFGWGSYGRNGVYDDYIGKEMSVTDGYWIVLMGVRGYVGFGLSFGLACLPVFFLNRRLKRITNEKDRRLMVTLGFIVGIGMFELIPNGLFSNYIYFLAGTLWGLTKGLTDKVPAPTKTSKRNTRVANRQAV